MPDQQEDQDSYLEVRCYFVRNRNALAVRADFSPAYMDHYLHLMQHEIKLKPEHDAKLKDAIAACTLHLASRPWNEVSAWTIHFGQLPLNLFVTGNSKEEIILSQRLYKKARQRWLKENPTGSGNASSGMLIPKKAKKRLG